MLSDEARRKRYDATGRTDEGTFGPGEGGEGGWEAYFEDLFDRLTAGKLDEMKKAYQGAFYSASNASSVELTLPQALKRNSKIFARLTLLHKAQ